MIAIPNMEKPQNCAECPISALSEFSGIVCKLNRDNDKSNCPITEIDLVRCGECKWCEKMEGVLWCNIWHDDTNGLNFCSYGERRADDNME